MKYVQPGVYFTESQKLLHLVSPLKKLYSPDGLTYNLLVENNKTKRERLLTIYRNLQRLTKYLQFHNFPKNSLIELFRVKLRQDYNYRRKLFLNNEHDIKDITDDEIYKRLVNTLNFVHNAALDSVDNKTARPVSKEYKILSNIIQYELSKNLGGGLKNKLGSQFYTIKGFQELRIIERAVNIQALTHKNCENADEVNVNIKNIIWWLENGILKNEVCFNYIKELQKINSDSPFLEKMALSSLKFEKYLVLLNEELGLLL